MRTATTKIIQIGILLTVLLISGIRTAQTAESTAGVDQKKDPYVLGIPVFQSEKAMKDWIRERLPTSKLIELERKGQKVCVALEPIGSGHITTTIYIFIKERTSEDWGIAVVWQTYTSEVKIIPPKGGKELTFKSKSGKTLFRVPFEVLEPKNHPDY